MIWNAQGKNIQHEVGNKWPRVDMRRNGKNFNQGFSNSNRRLELEKPRLKFFPLRLISTRGHLFPTKCWIFLPRAFQIIPSVEYFNRVLFCSSGHKTLDSDQGANIAFPPKQRPGKCFSLAKPCAGEARWWLAKPDAGEASIKKKKVLAKQAK